MDPATLLPPEIQDLLWSLAFDIAAVAVAVVAVLTTIKQAGAVLDEARGRCLDLPAVQVALKVAPLVIGALLGLAPGLFDGLTLWLQAIFGLIAGFASPGIYSQLKSQLPAVLLPKEQRDAVRSERAP